MTEKEIFLEACKRTRVPHEVVSGLKPWLPQILDACAAIAAEQAATQPEDAGDGGDGNGPA